ncbi:MAG: sugar ABC transporter permease [Oscillospiraceae bacterium]|nr:sugar ABC transporter permease [Oscillospiraceae bacterium]
MTAVRRKEMLAGYLFLLPSFAGFFVFVIYPILYGLYLSFTNGDGFNAPQWIGLANYQRLFKDALVLKSLHNNFLYTLLYVPANLALSLLVAVCLHSGLRGGRLYKTVLFFPYITSSIAITTIWKQLMMPKSGLINTMLRAMGMMNPPQWLSASSSALGSIVIVAVWAGFGFNMVVFLAGLQGISPELYEAGRIDGATGWKLFRHITFPLLSPTTFFLLTMGVISSFKVFDFIFQLTHGGPGNATTVLVYRIYHEGIGNMRFGYASAIAYTLFVIILLVTLMQFVLQKKWVYYDES